MDQELKKLKQQVLKQEQIIKKNQLMIQALKKQELKMKHLFNDLNDRLLKIERR